MLLFWTQWFYYRTPYTKFTFFHWLFNKCMLTTQTVTFATVPEHFSVNILYTIVLTCSYCCMCLCTSSLNIHHLSIVCISWTAFIPLESLYFYDKYYAHACSNDSYCDIRCPSLPKIGLICVPIIYFKASFHHGWIDGTKTKLNCFYYLCNQLVY